MDISSINNRLEEINSTIFQGKAELKIVSLKDLKLLSKNARFMEKGTFDQLTRNIKDDGFLSSVPLCIQEEDGKFLVLSGNHRVKSSREAGLEEIIILVDKRELSESRRISIQLSHNSLTGRDDKAILAELWAEISSMQEKLYAGLDSKTIEDIENERYRAFNAVRIPVKQMIFWFIPSEMDKIEDLLKNEALLTGDSTHIAAYKDYDKLVDLIIKVKKKENIKNSAMALSRLLEIAEKSIMKENADAV